MPTNRMLYTLEDVKNMIADFEDVKPEDVEIYECGTLKLDAQFSVDVNDNSYIFQVDK